MKDKLQNKKIRYFFYIILSVALTLVAFCILLKPDISMRIIYTPEQDVSMENTIWFDMGTGYQEDSVVAFIDRSETYKKRYFELFFKIPNEYRNPNGLKISLWQNPNEAEDIKQIKCLEIYNHNISMMKYGPNDLQELFNVEGAQEVYVDKDRICIVTSQNEQAEMIAGNVFLRNYRNVFGINISFVYNLLLLLLLLFGVMFLIDWIVVCISKRISKKNIITSQENKSLIWGLRFIMLGILCVGAAVIAYMALCSPHYAHPDEDVTRLAIDYYMGKWIPPDIRSNAAMGTFSYFGYSRLAENTVFYLIAGKIGWIFATFLHIGSYYRMFNVIMFIIMLAITIKHSKKYPCFILVLGITPQLWYLFSYATSDAFDFFISFLVLYQFVKEDSMLNQLLEKKARKPVVNILVCGFLFAMLLCAKENYYMILLFAFCVLLIRLWKTEKTKKAIIFQKYLLILLCTFLIVGIRIGINYYYYGTYNTGNAGGEMNEMNAADRYRPSALAEKGIQLTRAGKGDTIVDVFLKDGKNIVTGLIWSGVGNYGWMEYPHSGLYGYMIAGLCGILYLYIVWYMIWNRRKEGIRDSILLTGFLMLAYLMVLYICWRSDFQTQGRYILPLCIIVSYYSNVAKDVFQKKVFLAIMSVLCIFSVYSFVFNGLYHLT